MSVERLVSIINLIVGLNKFDDLIEFWIFKLHVLLTGLMLVL